MTSSTNIHALKNVLTKKQFREKNVYGYTLKEFYDGVVVEGETIIAPIRERQQKLVVDTANNILRIAAENKLEELKLERNQLTYTMEYERLQDAKLIPDKVTADMFRKSRMSFHDLAIEKDEHYCAKQTTYLISQGVLLQSNHIADQEEMKEYENSLVVFRDTMDKYRIRLNAYTDNLHERFIVEDKLSADPFSKIRKEIDGDDIKLRIALDKIRNYLKEISNFSAEIELFRDGGQYPIREPELPFIDGCKIKKLPPTIYHNVPEHPVVSYINENFGDSVASIRETGEKSRFSALQKLERLSNRNGLTFETALVENERQMLPDLNRITVVPARLAIEDRFITLKAAPYRYSEEDKKFYNDTSNVIDDVRTNTKPSGYTDHKIHDGDPIFMKSKKGKNKLELHFLSAETKFEDKDQLQADLESHKLYELLRLMMDENEQLTTNGMNPAQLLTIVNRYNIFMQDYSIRDTRYMVTEKIKAEEMGLYELRKIQELQALPDSARDTTVKANIAELDKALYKNLEAIKANLISLSQSIHAVAASHSDVEWQQNFMQSAYRLNVRCGREIIPEKLIKIADNGPTKHANDIKNMITREVEAKFNVYGRGA